MNFEEHAAKALLVRGGIPVPAGRLCASASEAAAAAEAIGPCAVKAQVPAGKRGKAGGIALVEDAAAAESAAARILAMEIAGHRVERVLVEARVAIERELYLAVLNDPASKGPLLLFSPEGGMEIEAVAAQDPARLLRWPIDIGEGLEPAALLARLRTLGFGDMAEAFADLVVRLYALYLECDAELLEINPLALTTEGGLVALDAKLVLDDSGAARQPELAAAADPEPLTALEARGRELGLKYIELDGSVGILANGAGLTMTTMDAVSHYGGRPANFLEIGGDAYTLGKPALEVVLSNPRVKSLVVNFCGAFARTDVMVGGLLEAWPEVRPEVPVFFSIHGTGEAEAIAMLRQRLGLEPFEHMDDAVRAAVAAAAEAGA